MPLKETVALPYEYEGKPYISFNTFNFPSAERSLTQQELKALADNSGDITEEDGETLALLLKLSTSRKQDVEQITDESIACGTAFSHSTEDGKTTYILCCYGDEHDRADDKREIQERFGNFISEIHLGTLTVINELQDGDFNTTVDCDGEVQSLHISFEDYSGTDEWLEIAACNLVVDAGADDGAYHAWMLLFTEPYLQDDEKFLQEEDTLAQMLADGYANTVTTRVEDDEDNIVGIIHLRPLSHRAQYLNNKARAEAMEMAYNMRIEFEKIETIMTQGDCPLIDEQFFGSVDITTLS